MAAIPLQGAGRSATGARTGRWSLGGVADKEPLPWNVKIAVGNNYRAAVETLTNQLSGILDIL